MLDQFLETTALAKNNFYYSIYLKTTMCKFLYIYIHIYIEKDQYGDHNETLNTSESDKTFFFIELYSGIKL